MELISSDKIDLELIFAGVFSSFTEMTVYGISMLREKKIMKFI